MTRNTPANAAARPHEVTAISLPMARLSLAAASTFLVLLAALHVLKPEIDPSWRPISEYAIGRYGWIMTLAFLSAGLSCVALLVAIRSQARRISGRIGLALLLVSAIGFFIAAVCTSDPVTAGQDELTTRGNLHQMGATLGGLLPFAAAFIGWSLFRNPAWTFARRSLLWATILVWAGELAMIVSMAVMLPQHGGKLGPQVLIGWPNRFMIVTYCVWLIIVAGRAAQVRRPRGAADAELLS